MSSGLYLLVKLSTSGCHDICYQLKTLILFLSNIVKKEHLFSEYKLFQRISKEDTYWPTFSPVPTLEAISLTF